MLKNFRNFAKKYKQVVIVALVIIVALALDLTGRDTSAHAILGVTAGIMVVPLLWDMLRTLQSGRYGIDVLAATAIITSIILGEYWAGIIIVLMLTGGEALEDYAENRAKTELTDLLKRRPSTARVLKGKKVVEVKAGQVAPGDKLIILPGEVIPVDGEVIEGSSSLDESSITGESLPVDKSAGSTVVSGSVNMDGEFTIRALRSAKESQYEQIIKLVRSASSSESPFVRLADRYSVPFTISAFFIAGTAWVVSGDPVRFLEVLVVATPCPLILGAPIALVSGMSRASKHGIIVKNGSTLERLAEVQTVAFDKTGTLTTGQLSIDRVQTFNNFKKETVLMDAASLEQSSNHILGKALVTEAASKNIKLFKGKNIKETAGHGLFGVVQNRRVLVGKMQLLQDAGIEIPLAATKPQSATAAYVAINGKFAGLITFKDTQRQESKRVVRALAKLGIKRQLLITGDNEPVARDIAKKTGITEVFANCLPADKMHVIDAEKYKPVAFIGDGVNDAPVLTSADVGIAMGAKGSTAASESADVVVMQDSLVNVYESIAIAKRTFSIARQAIFIGIFLSVGLMLVFSTGRFEAVQGALLQEVVDVAVIVYALRAHTGSKKLRLPS